MKLLTQNSNIKILLFVFVLISIIHVVYSTMTLRALTADGASYMLCLLNSLSDNKFLPIVDNQHPRYFILSLLQIPVIFSYYVLKIQDKFALLGIFSCVSYLIPLLILWLESFLAKRNERYDIFLLSLFNYCLILLLYANCPIVESFIGSILHFLLWEYLAAKFDYKKTDIIFIALLVIIMFSTFEYVVFSGPIFFIASLYYAKQTENGFNKKIKLFIGTGSLCAAIYNLVFMLAIPNEGSEIARFFSEFYDFLFNWSNLNILISFFAIIFLAVVFKRNILLGKMQVISLAAIFALAFLRLFLNLEMSLCPLLESHMRSISCYATPLMFLLLFVFDVKNIKISEIKMQNFLCIILLCGITQTCWQMVHCYYFDQNIRFMKKELAKSEKRLYIAEEHEEIGGINNNRLHRYITPCLFAATSILFSESYEQKVLLSHYLTPRDFVTFRNRLFVVKNPSGSQAEIISIPQDSYIKIKNKFWDLTECAKSVEQDNKDKNIQIDFYKTTRTWVFLPSE